jgi:hypothetical protein
MGDRARREEIIIVAFTAGFDQCRGAPVQAVLKRHRHFGLHNVASGRTKYIQHRRRTGLYLGAVPAPIPRRRDAAALPSGEPSASALDVD